MVVLRHYHRSPLGTCLIYPHLTAIQKQTADEPSVSVLVHVSSDHWDSSHLGISVTLFTSIRIKTSWIHLNLDRDIR